MRFCFIQMTLHSLLDESLAMTRRNCDGTKEGFSTSIAAPSGEILRTVQLMTDPSDVT
jgi:hypothetical protein